MSSTERVIGKLEEYMNWSRSEIKALRQDVQSLNQFRWKVYGGAMVISVLASVLTRIAFSLSK